MTININEVPTSIPTVSGNDLVAQIETARDQAQAARDAAIAAGAWDYTPADAAALAAIAGMTTGQTALVVSTMHLWRYSGSAWVDTGASPLAAKADKSAAYGKAVAEFGEATTVFGSILPVGPVIGSTRGRAYVSHIAWPGGALKRVRLKCASWDAGDGTLMLAFWRKGDSNTLYAKVTEIALTGITGDMDLTGGVDFPLTDVQGGLFIGCIIPSGGARVAIDTVSGGHYYSDEYSGSGEGTFVGSSATLLIETTAVTTPLAAEKTARLSDAADGHVSRAIVGAATPLGEARLGPAVPTDVVTAETTSGWSYLFNGVNVDRLVTDIFVNVSSVGSGLLSITYSTNSRPDFEGAALIYRQSVNISSAGVLHLVAGRDFNAFVLPASARYGFITASDGPRLRINQAIGAGVAYVYSGADPGDGNVVYSGQQHIAINFALVTQPTTVLMPRPSLPWMGAKAVALGDSLTDLYSGVWFPELQEITGISTIVERGQNGQVLAGMLDSIQAGDFTDAKLCLIGTGVNDWHHGGATIGSWGDAASANTIYGAIRKLIEGVYAQNPLTVPVFWGPFNTGQYTTGPAYGAANPYGLTITNITAAMEDACGRWGVPFFATQRVMGVNDLNLTTFLGDNIHPTDLGGQRLGYMLGGFLNRIQPMA